MLVGITDPSTHRVWVQLQSAYFSLRSAIWEVYFSGPLGRLHTALLLGGLVSLILYGAFVITEKNSKAQVVASIINVSKIAGKLKRHVNTSKNIYREKEELIRALVQDDGRYIQQLNAVKEDYMTPLANKKILTGAEIESIFPQWDHMIEMHVQFRATLKRLSKHGMNAMWRAAFNFAERLQIYKDITESYDAASVARGALMCKNARFAAFLESSDSAKTGPCLEEMLTMPLQRLNQFFLWYDKFLEITQSAEALRLTKLKKQRSKNAIAARSKEAANEEKQSDDEEEIGSDPTEMEVREMLASLNNLRKHVYDSQGWVERNKLTKTMMSWTPATRANLLDDPLRKLVQEGTLNKQCRKAVKPFHFWLFTDKLVYGEALNTMNININMPGMNLRNKEYTIHREIDLVGSRIRASKDPNIANRQRALLVECPAKSFVVWAPTIADSLSWIENIRRCTEIQRSNLEIEHHIIAPVWVPDAECSNCLLCEESFTLLRRRHHCRACGKVVCAACSSRRWLLAHVDSVKPVRTCEDCYSRLSNASTPLSPGTSVASTPSRTPSTMSTMSTPMMKR